MFLIFSLILVHYMFISVSIVYVVVNFLSQVIFVFLFCLGMVMYANEVETKGKYKLPKIEN